MGEWEWSTGGLVLICFMPVGENPKELTINPMYVTGVKVPTEFQTPKGCDADKCSVIYTVNGAFALVEGTPREVSETLVTMRSRAEG